MKKSPIILIMIALILILTSCSTDKEIIKNIGNNNENLHKGTGVYEYINLSDKYEIDLKRIDSISDGNILISYGSIDRNYFIINKDGEMIRELSLPEEHSWGQYALGEDDNLYIIREDGFNNRKIIIYDLDGNLIAESEEIKMINKANVIIRGTVDKNGLIYLLRWEGKLEVLNKKGEVIDTIEFQEGKIRDFAMDDKDNIYFIVQGSSGNTLIIIHNISSKEQIKKSILIEEDNWASIVEGISYDREKKIIYGFDRQSVWEITSEGELGEKIFSLREESIVDYIRTVFTIGNDYYIEGSIGQEGVLIKMEELDEEALANRKVLTIAVNRLGNHDSSLKDIKESIGLFKDFNPGAIITIIEAGDLSEEQFLKTINSDLMIGKGPDIFYGNFPYKSYMDKGVLMDLDKYIDRSEYYGNVLDAFKYKDKQYLFPIGFDYLKLYINNGILDANNIILDTQNWTIKDMEKIIEKVCKGKENMYYSFWKTDLHALLENIINSNIDLFVDFDSKEVRFDSEEFREILKSFKGMNEYATSENVDEQDVLFYAENYAGYLGLSYGVKDRTNFEIIDIPKYRDTSKTPISSLWGVRVVGINSNIKDINFGMEFIEHLGSEGHGIKYENTFLHINKNVAEWEKRKRVEGKVEPYKEIHEKFNINPISEINEDFIQTEEEFDGNLRDIDSINYYDHSNITDNIMVEIYEYLEGNVDLDTTVRDIQNKMELFIGE